MHTDEAGTNEVSERVIGRALRMVNALGAGFLEKVYENALAHELRKAGLAVVQQRGIVVRYDGVVVGEYAVDLLVGEGDGGIEGGSGADRGACSAMHQLPQGDRFAGLPAVQFRQAASGNPAIQARNLKRHDASVCICVHLWFKFLSLRCLARVPGQPEAVPASRDLPRRCGRCRRGSPG